MRNIIIGLFLAGFIFIGMFGFMESLANEQGVALSGDLADIKDNLENASSVVYASSQDDYETMEESKIYTGSTEIGIISADAYKVVKNSLKSTALVSNVTTQLMNFGVLPDWASTLIIGLFIITLAFLALAAVFRSRSGIS